MIIPQNVTKIEPGAFAGCTQLCGVTVSIDSIYFSCEDGALFNKDKTTLFYVPATLQGQQGKKDGRSIAFPSCKLLDARTWRSLPWKVQTTNSRIW